MGQFWITNLKNKTKNSLEFSDQELKQIRKSLEYFLKLDFSSPHQDLNYYYYLQQVLNPINLRNFWVNKQILAGNIDPSDGQIFQKTPSLFYLYFKMHRIHLHSESWTNRIKIMKIITNKRFSDQELKQIRKSSKYILKLNFSSSLPNLYFLM